MPCRITIIPNGGLRIEGEFELVDAEGRLIDLRGRRSVSLCRCGASREKPFCDGSHKLVGFKAPSERESGRTAVY